MHILHVIFIGYLIFLYLLKHIYIYIYVYVYMYMYIYVYIYAFFLLDYAMWHVGS